MWACIVRRALPRLSRRDAGAIRPWVGAMSRLACDADPRSPVIDAGQRSGAFWPLRLNSPDARK